MILEFRGWLPSLLSKFEGLLTSKEVTLERSSLKQQLVQHSLFEGAFSGKEEAGPANIKYFPTIRSCLEVNRVELSGPHWLCTR